MGWKPLTLWRPHERLWAACRRAGPASCPSHVVAANVPCPAKVKDATDVGSPSSDLLPGETHDLVGCVDLALLGLRAQASAWAGGYVRGGFCSSPPREIPAPPATCKPTHARSCFASRQSTRLQDVVGSRRNGDQRGPP
jgi:hypothetical protein